MYMQEIRLIAFALAVSLLTAAPSRAERLDEVLAEMDKAGKRLKTMTADFQQTDHDFILKDQEESRGKLYLAVPGRIRWEYAPPREKVLVVKDDRVRLFNPTANQVHEFQRGKGGAKSGGADLLIGFGSGNEKIRETYDVSLGEETQATASISLVPKKPQESLFTRIELTLDKKSWNPVRSVFHSPNRNRTEIRFENVVLNRDLPPATFELKLPPNVEIIRN